MKEFLTAILLYLLMFLPLQAQTDSEFKIQPTYLSNAPTAGQLEKASYETSLRFFSRGSVIGAVNIGMTDRFMMGISYGGERLIGTGKVDFYPIPGVDVRYRMIDESYTGPAVSMGFTNQGYGGYVKNADSLKINRFVQKSKGFYLVASKNYQFLGSLGFHGGINWAVTETDDKQKGPNFFIGLDKSLNKEMLLIGEYDFALNDNDDLIGKNDVRGYLNLGAKFYFNQQITFEFYLNDVLNNSDRFGKFSREIRISYKNTF